MRIDVHTHIVPEGWEDWAARFGGDRWPSLVRHDACRATIMTGGQFFRNVDDRSWSPERRIVDMDRLGIDRQALSPPPVMFCYWADARANAAFARLQNESVAAVVARHPARFVGMATVPLQDPDLAVKELRHGRERSACGRWRSAPVRPAGTSTTPRCSPSSRRARRSAWPCSSTRRTRWWGRSG